MVFIGFDGQIRLEVDELNFLFRDDKTLRNVVYKLVPGLHKDEMERRKKFQEKRKWQKSHRLLMILCKLCSYVLTNLYERNIDEPKLWCCHGSVARPL